MAACAFYTLAISGFMLIMAAAAGIIDLYF